MAVNSLSFSELRALSPAERERRLAAFAALRGQPINGELQYLDEGIAELESRYEMSSATMREKLASGGLRETADIGKWLMLLDARDALVTTAGQTRPE
jgi:hypothetical protein